MKYQSPSFTVPASGAPSKDCLTECGVSFNHIPSGPDSRRVCLRCGAPIYSMVVRGERCEIVRNYE